MPICKNNSKKQYTGDEPSPKGLGYCASGEKEGKIMKGKDGNTWIVSKGRWIKHQNDDYYKILMDKLSKWWQQMAQGNIIIIYQDGKHKLVTSSKKTHKAKSNDIIEKWKEFDNDKNITSCWGINKNGICTIKKTKIKEWNNRLNVLKEHITYWTDEINKTDKTVEIIQLFYDN